MTRELIKPLNLRDVTIEGPFWSRYIETIRTKVIPYQWEVLNDRIPDAARSHCIKNFEIAAGRRQGEFYGMCFQDSDLYKWLESVAYSLESHPDAALEALADSAIEIIGAAQSPDGYVNTFYTVKEPKGRWSNLQQGHELYCAGHLIEAAVAYHVATGKNEFLDIAVRFADCIDAAFGLDEGKLKGYPGHQEIELALYKLYKVTQQRRYLDLAAYFINQRGQEPNYFDKEQQKPTYNEIFRETALMDRTYSQSHIKPVEQKVAVGHSVRAMYMYCAMADLAAELDDAELAKACDVLYDDVTTKQMYITGAIGSASRGEQFTTAYDLPNDIIYGETCASVGLMMFARRMNAMYGGGKYADVMERALYNTVLAGISLAGTEFFYVNPLEADPKKIPFSPNYRHVKPVRQKWFDCACCPANVARTLMGLGLYVYGRTQDSLYVNLYCEGKAVDGKREIEISTSYPFDDAANITASGGHYKLYLRNPEVAPIISMEINGKPVEIQTLDGYIVIERNWQADNITMRFDMGAKPIYCAGDVQNNVGKAAIMRGPLVYCIEEVDNGPLLGSYMFADGTIATMQLPKGLLSEAVALEVPGYRYQHEGDKLYRVQKPTLRPATLMMIPYFMWANRGENEMRVFVAVKS